MSAFSLSPVLSMAESNLHEIIEKAWLSEKKSFIKQLFI